jgi:hypothetical protein
MAIPKNLTPQQFFRGLTYSVLAGLLYADTRKQGFSAESSFLILIPSFLFAWAMIHYIVTPILKFTGGKRKETK